MSRWGSLDPDGPPVVVFEREVSGPRIAVLLGAFDPPTMAHLEILQAAAAATGSHPMFGLTKVLLARENNELLSSEERVDVLDEVAERVGAGLLLSNRGTYIDVGRTLRARGYDATFIVGSDKLAQLEDPSFYEDGERGVESTFDELSFIVVARRGSPVERRGLSVLDPADVFRRPETAEISATEVRRRIREGADLVGLVPPEVAGRYGGYTSAG